MIPVEEMKKKRFEFLHRLYELSGADEHKPFNMFGLGEELGFEKILTQKIVRYLSKEKLIKHWSPDGVAITHWGIKAVEQAVSRPDEPTEYFPPVVNIISIGEMVGSQIQQAGPLAEQVIAIDEADFGLIDELLESLKGSMGELPLAPKSKADLEADIQTIEAQMSASKPKASIIAECLASIRRILEEAAGNVLATGFIMTINNLLAR